MDEAESRKHADFRSKPDPDLFKSPYFAFTINHDSEVIYVSRSIFDILGYTPQEVQGRNYVEFLDEKNELNSAVMAASQASFREGICSREVVLEAKSGELRVVNVQVSGEPDERGRIETLSGLAQDVTELHEVESELLERLAVLKKSQDRLSEREQQVLDRVLGGRLNKSIAKELEISQRAVEQIRARLLTKFEAETTAELVSKATEYLILKDVILLAHQKHPDHRPSDRFGEPRKKTSPKKTDSDGKLE